MAWLSQCPSKRLLKRYLRSDSVVRIQFHGMQFTIIFWRRFLVRVSCQYRTRLFWYQIPAPIGTLFFPSQKVTEMMTCVVDDNC